MEFQTSPGTSHSKELIQFWYKSGNLTPHTTFQTNLQTTMAENFTVQLDESIDCRLSAYWRSQSIQMRPKEFLVRMSVVTLPILTVVTAVTTVLTGTPAKALGRCPDGFVSIRGGYCREIVCIQSSYAESDPNALQAMKSEGASCEKGYSARWGEKVVKKSFRAMLGM